MTQFTTTLHNRSIACFISPHGYGHAARASAVMVALQEMDSSIRFEIFTTVPHRFFQDSLVGDFGYHSVLTDIGLAQISPLHQDLEKTIQHLDGFLPFPKRWTKDLAQQLTDLDCQLVICDISPLGIATARTAGLPSVLVENFTWDWIYQGYPDPDGRLAKHIAHLEQVFRAADYHIQTEPVCQPEPVDLLTRPISRQPRTPVDQVRKALEIPEQARLIMITMGGVRAQYEFLERLSAFEDIYFVIPGAIDEGMQVVGNRVLLAHHSAFFHPDLIHAADAVVGKVGYSTLAEVYHAGKPFGYVARPDFRESEVLTTYVRNHFNGMAIEAKAFETGQWTTHIPTLLDLPRISQSGDNGSMQVAAFIHGLLKIDRPNANA